MNSGPRTPRPWKVMGRATVRHCPENGNKPIDVAGFINSGDAHDAVTAVNAHADLVAALRDLIDACGNAKVFHMDLPQRNQLIDAHAAACAALAKATGAQP